MCLLAASAAVLAGLKFFLSKTRLHLPSSLRHGLANLYRPGNPSAALLAALGMGVMQIMTVYLVQQAVVSELHISAAPNLPNVFLIDITNGEVGGIRTLLKSQSSVTADPELLPVVSSRVYRYRWSAGGSGEAEELSQADAAVDQFDVGWCGVRRGRRWWMGSGGSADEKAARWSRSISDGGAAGG